MQGAVTPSLSVTVRAGKYLLTLASQVHNQSMSRRDGLSTNCAAGRHGTHSCAGCTCPCHPEAIRVSHGAPIEDHAATETRANVVRAAAGLPARRRYTRAA